MQAKKPRRTAERILEVTLELFNRHGLPNVSTTLISAELNISPGNLYYHYPAKDELVNSLFDRYERALNELLPAAGDVRNVEDAWLFFHVLFELIWQYRFLYRDLNDLVSTNRRVETHFQFVLKNKSLAVQSLLSGLAGGGAMRIDVKAAVPMATSMVVVLTYWLSYEFVREPRRALEPEAAGNSMMSGAFHVLSLLAPYLEPGQRAHLQALAGNYDKT
jgi:AcrR family transcriptional regulator